MTPAVAIPVEGENGEKGEKGDQIYKRGRPSDHMAIEVELEVDIVAARRSGNEPRIDYSKNGGWVKYKTSTLTKSVQL